MYMFKYVLKRLGLMLMTFAVIMIVCFVLIKLLPLVVPQSDTSNITWLKLEGRGYIQNLRYDDKGENIIGGDRVPIIRQLFIYIENIFVLGDFGMGVSIHENKPVLSVFTSKLPPTMLINIYSSLIGVPIGLGLGILAALKKNTWIDQAINVIIILLVSLPSIVLAVGIQYFLCYRLNLFPLMLDVNMVTDNNYLKWEVFHAMLPAVFALCLGSIAGYARYTRAELSEVLTNEFMLLARTKGLTRAQATMRHAMRNSMVVIFPSILSEFISILSGSLIIEQMFTIPGVGGLYLNAINAQDYDFFMFLSGFYTFVGLAAGIVIDISYGFIDPRIRMGAK